MEEINEGGIWKIWKKTMSKLNYTEVILNRRKKKSKYWMKNYNSGLQKLKKNNTNRIRKSETQGQNLLIYKWKFYLENNSQQDKKKQRKKKKRLPVSATIKYIKIKNEVKRKWLPLHKTT